jgi:hypothetical protein
MSPTIMAFHVSFLLPGTTILPTARCRGVGLAGCTGEEPGIGALSLRWFRSQRPARALSGREQSLHNRVSRLATCPEEGF